MDKDKIKGYAGAFVVGGGIGVVGQLFLNLYLAAGLSMLAAVYGMILTLAVLGVILTLTGVYQKLTGLGGMGAMMPMSGLSGGIAETVMGLYKNGASMWEALAGGMKAPAQIFGVGIAVALVLSVAAG